MNTNTALLTTLLLAACGPAFSTGGDTSSAIEQAKSFGGHWALETLSSASWIQEINLHADGTFEGSFGDSVSNNSGFLSNLDGTYTFDTSTSVLTLTHASGSAEYSVKRKGTTAALAFIGDSDANDSFTMSKLPAPQVLTFAADSSPHDVLLEVDTPVLVWYDAQRDSCPVSPSTKAPVIMLAVTDGNFGEQQVLELPPTPVDGVYRALFDVPSGERLTVWFELVTTDASGDTTCLHYDSNDQQNYEFQIVTP